ncbi:HAMP domain-containing protein [bacterium]|nr:HAMP domain-containing protein [bacterium]
MKRHLPTADSRLRMRLIISVPALLMLVCIGTGLVSYLSFEAYWDRFIQNGMGDLAGRLLRVHLSAMLILAVVAGSMGLLLAHAILKPIRAIADATRNIADGRLEIDTPKLPAAPELEELSHSFDDMIQRLRESFIERNRHLMAGIPIGAITTDSAGRISAVSPQAASILNLPEQALVGRKLEDLGDVLPATSRAIMAGILDRLVDRAALEDEEFTVGSEADNTNGVIVSSTWLRNSRQEPYGRLLCFRPSAPMSDLSDHLSRTDQLAALGTFCLGLAHELRNPLGAIKGLSQLLQLERGLQPNAQEYIRRMVGEVDRVDRFIGRLLEMTDEPTDTPRLASIDDIIRLARLQAEFEVEPARREKIMLRCRIAAGLPQVRIQSERVGQAVGRILQNAYESAAPESVIEITAALGAKGIELSIHNDGSTIAPENRRRIFEPFFTTRERATGLGLTIARQVIAQNGGSLDCACGGNDVTFIVRLPAETPIATEGIRP